MVKKVGIIDISRFSTLAQLFRRDVSECLFFDPPSGALTAAQHLLRCHRRQFRRHRRRHRRHR